VRVRVGRAVAVAKLRDQNWKLSVDVEFTANVTGPANAPTAAAFKIALYRASGTVGGANDPTPVPTAGRFVHVNVVSDHPAADDNDTTCESAEPAAASVVVRTDNVAPTNDVPAGAAGNVNFKYAVNDDDPPREFIDADVP
jgi:hypothetical protein